MQTLKNRYFIVEKVCFDYKNILCDKKKIVLLRTDPWKLLWKAKNGSSKASLLRQTPLWDTLF